MPSGNEFDEDTSLLLQAICIFQAVFFCQLPFKKRKAWVKE